MCQEWPRCKGKFYSKRRFGVLCTLNTRSSSHCQIMRYRILIVFWLAGQVLNGQDLHYSQGPLNLMAMSPAAAGMFQGDLRASAVYRSQWQQVPVAYRTFSGAADWKAIQRGANQLSFGAMLQHDQAGDAGLSWLQLGMNFGVAHALDEDQKLSIGFGVAMIQRSFNIRNLTFKNQWGGDTFDPGLPTGENFNQASGLAASLSAGLHYQFRTTESRTGLDFGGGIFHWNQPVVSLGDFAYQTPYRISSYLNADFQIHYLYDLVFFNQWQKMAEARELLIGAGIRRVLSSGLANDTKLQLALAYRFGDALVPSVQLERNNWLIGVSYDWNTSRFNTATNGRGGIEIAVIWKRIPVPVLKTVKSCPPF